MLKRNITAAVLIVIALLFIGYLRTLFIELTDILFFAFMIVGAVEMWQVGKEAGRFAFITPLILFAVIIYPLFYFFGGSGVLFSAMIALLCATTLFLFKRETRSFDDLTYTVFILFYPMILSTSFFVINHGAGSLLGILFVLLVTLLSDAFALFAGMLFGKKKLMEDVSPKKTVAGAVGAYVGGLLGATVVLLLFDVFGVFKNFGNVGIIRLFEQYYISVPVYFVLSVLCTTLAIIGDLVASLIKRRMMVKDFGKIFPGHGGVMDRLDSLLFVAPVVALFFTIYGVAV